MMIKAMANAIFSRYGHGPWRRRLMIPGVCLLCALAIPACDLHYRPEAGVTMTENKEEAAAVSTTSTPVPTAKTYRDADLAPIAEVCPGVVVDLTLAGTDHPFGVQMYRKKTLGHLRYGTALKVRAAQERLQEQGLGLKIWDSYRPFIVQVALFEAAGGNPNWVSDPYRQTGKKTHVRGVAIDCTIIDAEGRELEMPTPYLDFEHGAERMKHSFTNLPKPVIENRALLKSVMAECGMEAYTGEWWHYQDADWEHYPVIESAEFPEVHQILLTEDLWRRIAP